MDHPRETFARLLDVWNGEAALDELDALVSASYRGHLGSRERDLARLKQDIAEYRERVPGVRFSVEHQFGQDEDLATRLTAHAPAGEAGTPTAISGLNISRWDNGLLAEEWAVWEAFDVDR